MRRTEFERRLAASAPFARLNPEQVGLLWRHYELMERWNARINLTRVVELEQAVRVHYAESLFVAERVPQEARTLVDVGSGAGFPGLVIAVARPDMRVTLLESDLRKAAFLREVSDWVPNLRVEARWSREAEGQWDVVVSRAVRAVEVVGLGERVGRWVLLVGTEPPMERPGWSWRAEELPGGRGRLWVGVRGGRGLGKSG